MRRVVIDKVPVANMSQAVLLSQLWMPRGFLLYPATSIAPRGYGLPVVPLDSDSYAPINLAPGLDTNRWTSGGPCGQVLLTRDVDAGYVANPLLLDAPALFSTDEVQIRNTTTDLSDARPFKDPWTAYRMEFVDFTAHFANEDQVLRRAMFSAFNAQRSVPAYLWPRGYYRPAEFASYWMTTSVVPKSYMTPGDRLTKDGYWTDVASTDEPPTASGYGTPQRAFELQASGGDVDRTLAKWAANDAASVNYVSPDSLPLFLDVGWCKGNWCMSLEERDQWIEAGHASWQSPDAELPPISWNAPSSRSLSFLTLPAVMDGSAAELLWGLVDAGRFYAVQYQSTYVFREYLGRVVYARGRAIARLPNEGYVLGAGIMTSATNDRLVVIAYHAADQTGNWETVGVTNHVRVWYIDYPRKQGLRLLSESVVCVAGTSGAAWQGGDLYTVPGLKYESLWEFSHDGSRAVCLRDTFTIADYQTVINGAGTGGVVLMLNQSGKAAVVEMTFIELPEWTVDVVTTPLLPQGSSVGRPISELPHHPSQLAGVTIDATEFEVTPLAAGYDADDNIVLAFRSAVSLTANGTVAIGTASVSTTYAKYEYVGTGNVDCLWTADLLHLQLMSCSVRVPEMDFSVTPESAQVVDIVNAIFVVGGYSAPMRLDYALLAAGKAPYTANPNWPTCMVGTTDAIFRVSMYKEGALVYASAYVPPPGVWNQFDLTWRQQLAGSTVNNLITSIINPMFYVQPFYVERFGEWIMGYQVGPTAPDDYSDVPVCAPDIDQYVNAQSSIVQTPEQRTPTGGFYTSSFTLPPGVSADWLSEALVV